MEVLSTWSGKFILRASVLEMFITIMGCYLIAVSLGHVPIWLPMISDCAVKPPEMYIFRLGIAIGAFMIGFQSITVYIANKERPLSKLCAALGTIGSIGLGVVAVVNEKENDHVHSFCAVMFFICYDLYMIISVVTSIKVAVSPFSCSLHITWLSFIIKTLLAIIGTIAGVIYTMNKFGLLHGSIALAIVEWVDTFTIMGFVWSFLLDEFLDHVDLAEVRTTASSISQKVLSLSSPPPTYDETIVPLVSIKDTNS